MAVAALTLHTLYCRNPQYPQHNHKRRRWYSKLLKRTSETRVNRTIYDTAVGSLLTPKRGINLVTGLPAVHVPTDKASQRLRPLLQPLFVIIRGPLPLELILKRVLRSLTRPLANE